MDTIGVEPDSKGSQMTSISPTNADGDGRQAAVARVASEAPAQAARVVGDARTQVTSAAQRTLADLRTQADDRAAQAARGLRDLSSQVDALAAGRPEEAGNLTDMVQAAGQQASDFADRLDMRGVQGVVDDVTRFGRQHPWAFLGLSLGAGFLVGRVVRTGAAVASEQGGASDQQPTMPAPALGTAQPASPSTTYGDRHLTSAGSQ
jgi:ElaB/YqjD/DUF883 family membrane-anchored ribosome-binding protein